jgi:TonB family protein
MRPIRLATVTLLLVITALAVAQSAPHVILIAPPTYPDTARQARIQGTVVVHIELDKNGKVEKSRVLSGHPVLTEGLLETVRNWEFECRTEVCPKEHTITFKYVLAGSQQTDPAPVISLELPHRVTITAHPLPAMTAEATPPRHDPSE